MTSKQTSNAIELFLSEQKMLLKIYRACYILFIQSLSKGRVRLSMPCPGGELKRKEGRKGKGRQDALDFSLLVYPAIVTLTLWVIELFWKSKRSGHVQLCISTHAHMCTHTQEYTQQDCTFKVSKMCNSIFRCFPVKQKKKPKKKIFQLHRVLLLCSTVYSIKWQIQQFKPLFSLCPCSVCG